MVKYSGQMAESTKDSTKMIKNMGRVHSSGLMDASTLEDGLMESSMVEVSTSCKMDRKKQDNGFRAKELNGLKIKRVEVVNKTDLFILKYSIILLYFIF